MGMRRVLKFLVLLNSLFLPEIIAGGKKKKGKEEKFISIFEVWFVTCTTTQLYMLLHGRSTTWTATAAWLTLIREPFEGKKK